MHRIRPRRFSLSRLLLICLCVLLLGLAAYAFFSNGEYGHMDITVVDAYSLQPVEGAVLVFPDAGLSTTTDQAGRAQVFGLPIQRHSQQNRLLRQVNGECTLLVYKAGYIPYALFYVQVPPGRVRNGPTVYLFPQYDGAPEVVTIVESPAYDWAKALMEQYRPQQIPDAP